MKSLQMEGGKRSKTRKSVARSKSASKKPMTKKSMSKKTKSKKSKKSSTNPFFKLMLDAKSKSLPSFKYKSKTYKGVKHPHLGMIYRKA
jgi:hypothetical protein